MRSIPGYKLNNLNYTRSLIPKVIYLSIDLPPPPLVKQWFMALTKIDVIKIYQQKKALVIDDYPDMRSSIRKMLEHFGVVTVDTCSNGEEAIIKCEQTAYDIILADYNLGNSKNGQQILEELRYKRRLKNTAIYMMITAETTKHMVFGALENQPDDYLTKPFTQGVLQKRLDRMVLEKQALYPINAAIDLQNYERAISLCRQHIDRQDKYQLRCSRIMADCLYTIGKFNQAKNLYQDILDQRDLEWANIGLAKCMMALDKLPEAEALFNQLVVAGCPCMEIYDCLAEIKLRQHDNLEAQNLLESAVNISPNALIRQSKLAEICEDNKDWEAAKAARIAVIRLSTNSVYATPEQQFKLARCINKQIRHSTDDHQDLLDEAAAVLQQAKSVQLNFDNLELHADILATNLKATVDEQSVSDNDIIELQERIKSAQNASAQLLLDMAETYQAAGHHDKAQALLKTLMDSYQDNPAICSAIDKLSDEPLTESGKEKVFELNQQGKELFAKQQYRKAIALFTQALRHHPNNIGLNLNLMLALVSEMTTEGGTREELDHCNVLKEKLSHINPGSPLYDRYQALCIHLDKVQLKSS